LDKIIIELYRFILLYLNILGGSKIKSAPSTASAVAGSSNQSNSVDNVAVAGASVGCGIEHSAYIDMPIDPNEPTFCLCKQVFFGEMIACDNPDVSISFLI